MPRQRRVWIIYKNIINEYLKYEYSLIPIDSEKKPYIYWKPFQYKKAITEDVFDWYNIFCDVNIGIVTGNISKLAVIDVDDPNLLPELEELLPELNGTTRVRTRRGYHYYFSLNGEQVKSTNNLFGRSLELKSDGNYVVAPPSIIKKHQYVYEVPISEMLPIPRLLIEKENEPVSYEEDRKHKTFKIPKYHGKKVDCIRQIISRDLQIGERDNSLYILYNSLLQNDNTKDHSKKIVTDKNKILTKPLPDKEVENLFKKHYNLKCSSIIEKLPFIKCDKCKRFKGGLKEMVVGSAIIKNLRELPKLSNTERGILCLVDVYFSGENPSIYELSKVTGMNKRTVKKAIEGLEKKGII